MELNVKQEPPADMSYEFIETAGEPSSSYVECKVSEPYKPIDGDYPVHQLQEDVNCSDEDMLFLLQEWGLEMLSESFAKNLIDVSLLDYIVDVDIVDLCKGFPMRYRIILRHKLEQKAYKREKRNQSQSPVVGQQQIVETPVVSQDVPVPMESCQELYRLIETPMPIPSTSSPAAVTMPASTSQKKYFTKTTLPEFDLVGILTTSSGEQIIQCYERHGRLDIYHRKKLLGMIIDKIRTDIPMKQFNARWYDAILKDVVIRFPSEEKYRNAYISRLAALKYNTNKKVKTYRKKNDSTRVVVMNEQESAYSDMSEMPKRPLSAYMLWLNSAREQITKDNPDHAGNVQEIARKSGEIWRAMKDKTEWESKATEQWNEYQKALQEFRRNYGSRQKEEQGSLDGFKEGQQEEIRWQPC